MDEVYVSMALRRSAARSSASFLDGDRGARQYQYGDVGARIPKVRSLIVHEIAHGVMHQNLTRKAMTHAAYEYPAYALQLESLPADVRDVFLHSFDQTALRSNTLFNDSVLFFDPYFFAARAYHHYANAPDACAHITSLLNGEVAFVAPPM